MAINNMFVIWYDSEYCKLAKVDSKADISFAKVPINNCNGKKFNNAVVVDNMVKENNSRAHTLDKSAMNNSIVTIVCEFVNIRNDVIGYRIIRNINDKVYNIKREELIRYVKQKQIILQNAMYVESSEDRDEHIRFFIENQVMQVNLGGSENKEDSSKRTVSKSEDEYNKNRSNKNEDELAGFSEVQKKIIQLGRTKYNIDLLKYIDNRYDSNSMSYLLALINDKYDVSALLNPRYSMYQMAEIMGGIIDGLDVSSYANPDISLTDMQEEHSRLFRNQWYTELFKDN